MEVGMARKNLWSKRTMAALGVGQLVSLLVTSTGFTSSELARRGINAPTSQSFLNYVLLAIVFGGMMLYRRQGLKAKWYYYLLLAFVDVQANCLVVKAYQYTSITSVMLLDCWTIPCVLLLTWIFLKTRYKITQLLGAAVCIAGLVLVIFSDVHATDRHGGSKPFLGDMLVVGGSMLYAISNVTEEFFVKNVDRIELMAMLGLFGSLISACQVAILERHELKAIDWNVHAVLPFLGYAAALFLFYVLVPILLQISGAALLNLSLLTSDMWAVLIRIFAYHQKVDWLYFVAFGGVAIGLIIYSVSGNEDMEDGQTHELPLHGGSDRQVNKQANTSEPVELYMAQSPNDRDVIAGERSYTIIKEAK